MATEFKPDGRIQRGEIETRTLTLRRLSFRGNLVAFGIFLLILLGSALTLTRFWI